MKVLHIVACSRALNHSQICVIRSIKSQSGFVSAAQAQLFHCYLYMTWFFQSRAKDFWMHERNICKYSCR